MSKARYWWAVMYPDRMVDDWQSVISDKLQLPYCYCIHDKDLLNESDDEREVHIHLIVAFHNTTTFNHALEVFNSLYKQEKPLKMIKQIINIRFAYDYLIHDTDDCRKKKKHLYDKSERISGNSFDIGAFEQLGVEEKQKIIDDIRNIIYVNDIFNFKDLDKFIMDNYDLTYNEILRKNHGYFTQIIKGNYQELQFKYEKNIRRSSNLVSDRYKNM